MTRACRAFRTEHISQCSRIGWQNGADRQPFRTEHISQCSRIDLVDSLVKLGFRTEHISQCSRIPGLAGHSLVLFRTEHISQCSRIGLLVQGMLEVFRTEHISQCSRMDLPATPSLLLFRTEHISQCSRIGLQQPIDSQGVLRSLAVNFSSESVHRNGPQGPFLLSAQGDHNVKHCKIYDQIDGCPCSRTPTQRPICCRKHTILANKFLKQCELVRCLSGFLDSPAMERQDALILFVGQLQDADLASWRQNGFHPLAVGFHLR